MKDPSKTIPFMSYGDAKKCDQSDFPYLAQKRISTMLINFTLTTTANTDSEGKSSTSKYP